ncbi:MAG: carbon-nitrogen hydrolase family protein [Phycisphaerae bacterium]
MNQITIRWQPWAPRSVQQPATEQRADGTLLLSADQRQEIFGGFRGQLRPLQQQAWYRVCVQARLQRLTSPRHQTCVQLRLGDETFRYLADVHPQPDGRCRYEITGRSYADVGWLDILLVRCPGAAMVVEQVSIERIDPPRPRPVRLCSIYDYIPYRPDAQPIENFRRFAKDIDRAVERFGPLDLIVLPEAINLVGITTRHYQAALAVPGPETDLLAARAAKHKACIVAGLFEQQDDCIYNAAILFGRDGQIIGRYHKVQLPNQEISDGIKPGNELPVFQTDFGRIGMLICHDTTYPEPARVLMIRGAEIVAVPIWGGRQVCLRSRAQENGLWIITSGYNYPCQIINPEGNIIAQTHPGNGARGPQDAICATVDLAHPPVQPWYGDMRDLQFKERRDDLYGPMLGRQPGALPR